MPVLKDLANSDTSAITGKVAILVLSCDKYSDLWRPFFKTFYEFWPDVPFPVYLLANEKTHDDSRVTTLLSGPDRDWSSSLKRVLEQIKEPHVFLMIEDAFLDRPVETPQVLDLARWAVDEQVTYLRLRPSPPPDEPYNDLIGRLHPGALYRTSLFVSIWKKDVLLSQLQDGESAWKFELTGHERTQMHADFFATRKPVFSYIHGVEKGLWHRAAVRKLKKLGCDIDLGYRPQMTVGKTVLWYLSSLKGTVLGLFPAQLRPAVLKTANQFYKLIGYRS